MEWILRFGSELVKLTVEMAPYLLLGFLFAGILYAWFPNHKMVKYLGKNNSSSVFNAALLGVPLPLCSCGVIPTGISFYRNGASKGSTVAFLISTPQTGADSIMVTWSLLGWPLAVLRPVIALVTGMLGGLLTNFSENRSSKKNQKPREEPKIIKPEKVGIMEMLRYAFVDFLQDIVKWLTIGLLIAALMAVIIPEDFFLRYLSNDYLSMLIILVASIPLYVCATGSVPIAAVLMMKGLSPGAALVFLMAGPATNAATISVIGNTMGRKTLFTYLFSIISGALFFGILINEFLPRDLFINAISHIHNGVHSHEILPHWFQVGSAILLALLMINGLLRLYVPSLYRKSKNIVEPEIINTMNFKTIMVEGMTCNHCKMTVENNLKKIPGVSKVNADPVTGKVTLEGDSLNLSEAEKTVNDLGYKYKGAV
ncbi:MAG: permease [Bacteroidales bacterium]|nr:permease [Bacteroidales bacterium]MCB9000190.1 permease [Bacteroidales bacterium]